MRVRPTRRIFWVVLAGSVLTLSLLLLLNQHHHSLPRFPQASSSAFARLPSSLQDHHRLLFSSGNGSSRLQDVPAATRAQNYPVPPRPPQGDAPPYPIPEGLKEGGAGDDDGDGGGGDDGGDGGRGNASETTRLLGQQDESPLELADGLWNLLRSPKEVAKEGHQQGAPDSTCKAKHHIFFGKVHKTGSSTVANLLQRFGFTRDLNFVLPRKRIASASYNYFTSLGQNSSRHGLIPAPLGQHYDVLWCHGIYNGSFFHDIMPKDTVFITILRHPLTQFQSSFEYYGRYRGSYLNRILMMNVSNPLSEYLHNTAKYENPKKLTTFIRNKQSEDLGMVNQHVLNAKLRRQYIHQLSQDFQLVMLTELFDESLVLLRRLMCWSLKDILYIPKNKNNHKKKLTFSSKDLKRHRELNVADFDLYEFFHQRFQDTLKQQGADFQRELVLFKRLLQRVQTYCGHGSTKPLQVAATVWGDAFTVSRYDCMLMQKHELPFLNDLVLEAVRKYERSVFLNLNP